MQNAIKYVKQLETVGLTREQAEAHIQIMTEFMESNLATKQDLLFANQELKHEIGEVRSDIDLLRSDVEKIEQKIVLKLGTIVSIAIGIAVALTKIVLG